MTESPMDELIRHLEIAQKGYAALVDRLEMTTDALEVSSEPWSGAAKARAEKHIAENRDLIAQIRKAA